MQSASLCRACIAVLWETVKSQIAAGICWWAQTPIQIAGEQLLPGDAVVMDAAGFIRRAKL